MHDGICGGSNDLENIEASIRDLVPVSCEKEKVVMAKSLDFGPSLMTKGAIKLLEKENPFPAGKGRAPRGETIPCLEPDEAVVFKEFFSCGLRFPTVYFLRLVLDTFKVQLHHRTPNEILTLSKFCYACETYGAPPDLDTFCAYYELQRQPKKVEVDGVKTELQFASCAFMVKRSQKYGGLEISFTQKNKWEKDWTRYWFYVKTPGVVLKTGPKVKKYPFASIMGVMKPCTHVGPPAEIDEDRAACDIAFAKAYHFFRARDLVEEMVASNFWPLGKNRPEMKLVKMKLPVFGSEDGEFCPSFFLQHAEDKTDEEFVSTVEQSASMINGEISEKEYLFHRVIGETMPQLNQVFEEMKVTYGYRKVLDKVLKSIEGKAAKATHVTMAPTATPTVKKADAPKAAVKKRKSAKTGKSFAAEEVADSTQGGPATAPGSAEASAALRDLDLMGSSL